MQVSYFILKDILKIYLNYKKYLIKSVLFYGKAPIGVAKIAKKYNIPVVAVAAIIGDDADIVYQYSINTLIKVSELPMSLTESKIRKVQLIKRRIKQFLEKK